MRGNTVDTQNDAEAWEEPQDEDPVIPSDSASDGSPVTTEWQSPDDDDTGANPSVADADLPGDTANWTNALASMSFPDSGTFGAWIDAISNADLPGPHDRELAELFSEDDSQISFDSDEQVVL